MSEFPETWAFMARLEGRARKLDHRQRATALLKSAPRIPFRSTWIWPQLMLLVLSGMYPHSPHKRVELAKDLRQDDHRPEALLSLIVTRLHGGAGPMSLLTALQDPGAMDRCRADRKNQGLPELSCGADDPVMQAKVMALLEWLDPGTMRRRPLTVQEAVAAWRAVG